MPGAARASGGTLPHAGLGGASEIRVDAAVATRAAGSVRWSRVSVKNTRRVLWLVPARPGAALDWAGDTWLDALDASTRPVVMRPATIPTNCVVAAGPIAIESFSAMSTTPRRDPRSLAVLEDEIAARAYAASLGYAVDGDAARRLSTTFAAGWLVVALEVWSDVYAFKTPALRVEDMGAPDIVPFALAGDTNAETRATVFVISSGAVAFSSSVDFETKQLRWARRGAPAEAERVRLLSAAPWVREAAGSSMLLERTPIPDGGELPSLIDAYFEGVPGGAACASSARSLAAAPAHVGTACAAGALARVPGGEACATAGAEVEAAAFACGSSDDLALAVSGRHTGAITLSRWAHLVKAGTSGADAVLEASAAPSKSPITRTDRTDCGGSAPSSPASPSGPKVPPSSTGLPSWDDWPGLPSRDDRPATRDAYAGSTSTTRRSDSCAGGSSTTVSTSDDYDFDDNSGCGGSSSSSSSGSSGGSSWGDSDDWDDAAPTSKGLRLRRKPHAANEQKRRGPSPLSRMAIVLAFVALPVRRALAKKAPATRG
jgi:hypothetical protein